jgi:histidyl-tRNA synthetase
MLDVLKTIDKFDKIGSDGVYRELIGSPEQGGRGFAEGVARAIIQFIERTQSNEPEERLAVAESLMRGSPIALEGIRELRAMTRCIQSLGVSKFAWDLDFALARGLEYYTGPVFETMLTKLPSMGSVFSGGRYDGLVGRFGEVKVPATGASVGVDRLFAAMEELSMLPKVEHARGVLVLNFDEACERYCLEAVRELRTAGIASSIYFGNERTLKAQLTYAVKNQYPIVVVIGSDEMRKGTAQMKNMATRAQTEVRITELAASVQEIMPPKVIER